MNLWIGNGAVLKSSSQLAIKRILKIKLSAPNLVRMYMTIRSRMSSIIEQIGPKLSKLSALELENLPFLTLLLLISTELGHNISAHKVSDEFNYGSNSNRNIWSYLP